MSSILNYIEKNLAFRSLLSIIGSVVVVAISFATEINPIGIKIPVSIGLQIVLWILSAILFFVALYLFIKWLKGNKPVDNPIEEAQFIRIGEFINALELSTFDEILILGHTGNATLTAIRAKLAEYSVLPTTLSIKVLLKDPNSENTERQKQIIGAQEAFKKDVQRRAGCSVEIRYYNGLPYFHAILCKKTEEERYVSYISHYRWQGQKTKAAVYGYKVDQDDRNPLFYVTKSWFDHLFAPKKLHTIVFDLDDTIIDSFELQKRSWKNLFEAIFENRDGLGRFCQKIKDEINRDNMGHKIDEVFLNTTLTSERWEHFFTELLPNEIQQLKDVRFQYRSELTTSNAALFAGCHSTLRELAKTYNLVILSATSEEIIDGVLHNHELNSYFSLYLGNNNAIDDWDMEDKTPYLFKISNLTGMPFERMMLIGDSQTDKKAADQLGMRFVAANMIACRYGRESFVDGAEGFSSYTGNSLINIIESVRGS